MLTTDEVDWVEEENLENNIDGNDYDDGDKNSDVSVIYEWCTYSNSKYVAKHHNENDSSSQEVVE